MDQLIKTLPSLMRAAGDVPEVALTAAQVAWNHVAGEVLRLQTAAIDFQNRRLTVAVADSVWQRQLESMSGQLLYRLNALIGEGTILFIEFRVDPGTLEAKVRKTHSRDKSTGSKGHSEQTAPELISAAASIKDPALRRAFLGAADSCVRRTESDKARRPNNS
jgi:hypothetical protein